MLQQMAREGAHAKGVRGVFPSVMYPSHTTLVTGARPANHGILLNRNPGSDWNFFHDDITTLTLWELVGENGGTTVNVGWPVTVGAPIDYNVVIPGALSNSGLADDPIRDLTTPEGLFEELEREATGRLDVNDDLSNRNPAKEGRVAEMASYLIAQHQPQLLTVALQVTDSFQHRYGREAPAVEQALAAADRAVARIMEELERHGLLERTAFVIGGDHGFSDIHLRLQPNVWLAEAGLFDPENPHESRARFETSGGAAFLYLADPEDTEALNTITQRLDTLPHRRPGGSAYSTATHSMKSAPIPRHPLASPLQTGSCLAVVLTAASLVQPRAVPMVICPTSPPCTPASCCGARASGPARWHRWWAWKTSPRRWPICSV